MDQVEKKKRQKNVVYMNKRTSKYHRPLTLCVPTKDNTTMIVVVYIDVYMVLKLFGVSCHRIGHALKKLLAPGARGHKDYIKDVTEAVWSAQTALDEKDSPIVVGDEDQTILLEE